MSRLLEALPSLAVAVACFAVEHRSRDLVAEVEYYRKALEDERNQVARLTTRVVELSTNRDAWINAYDEKSVELKKLREEIAMAKKPPAPKKPMPKKPPKKGGKPMPCAE